MVQGLGIRERSGAPGLQPVESLSPTGRAPGPEWLRRMGARSFRKRRMRWSPDILQLPQLLRLCSLNAKTQNPKSCRSGPRVNDDILNPGPPDRKATNLTPSALNRVSSTTHAIHPQSRQTPDNTPNSGIHPSKSQKARSL